MITPFASTIRATCPDYHHTSRTCSRPSRVTCSRSAPNLQQLKPCPSRPQTDQVAHSSLLSQSAVCCNHRPLVYLSTIGSHFLPAVCGTTVGPALNLRQERQLSNKVRVLVYRLGLGQAQTLTELQYSLAHNIILQVKTIKSPPEAELS